MNRRRTYKGRGSEPTWCWHWADRRQAIRYLARGRHRHAAGHPLGPVTSMGVDADCQFQPKNAG